MIVFLFISKIPIFPLNLFFLINNDFKTNENLFVKKNKFKGKIGIFEINKKIINNQLNFYEIQDKNFKEIF